ncbi:MAG: hypothetical protein WAW23_13205 [Candidatus Methanoperedens sp.]
MNLTEPETTRKKLRTPMSIKKLIDFSKDVENVKDLMAEIEKAAENTKIAFSKEIKEMFKNGEYDSLVFLSFPYIGVSPKVAKLCYNEVLKDLGYGLKTRNFNDLTEEINEVEISNQYSPNRMFGIVKLTDGLNISEVSSVLRYIHPTYWDAFGFALTDDNKPNNISTKIFSCVLWKLLEKDDCGLAVAWAVESNFDKLPENIRNEILLKLSEKDSSERYLEDFKMLKMLEYGASEVKDMWYLFDKSAIPLGNKKYAVHVFDKVNDTTLEVVSRTVAKHFDKFSKKVRHKLLFNLSEKGDAAIYTARTIANNFDKLPSNVRNEVLLKLSKKFGLSVLSSFKNHEFEKLPTDVKNVLILKYNKHGAVAPDNSSEHSEELVSGDYLNFKNRMALLKLLQQYR